MALTGSYTESNLDSYSFITEYYRNKGHYDALAKFIINDARETLDVIHNEFRQSIVIDSVDEQEEFMRRYVLDRLEKALLSEISEFFRRYLSMLKRSSVLRGDSRENDIWTNQMSRYILQKLIEEGV